jgi:hypothetical protein
MSEREHGQLPLPTRALRSRISSECWEQIKTARASGIGLREIARNMGIPEGTVLAHAKREGWTREIQNAKALAKREDSAPAVTRKLSQSPCISAESATWAAWRTLWKRLCRTLKQWEPGAILDRVDDVETLDKVARRTFGISDANEDPTHWAVNIAILNA